MLGRSAGMITCAVNQYGLLSQVSIAIDSLLYAEIKILSMNIYVFWCH